MTISINIPRDTITYRAVKSAILSENMLQQAVNRFRDGYGEHLLDNLVFGDTNQAPFRFTTAGLTFDEINQLVPNRYKNPWDLPAVIGLTWDELALRPMLYDIAYAYQRQQRDYGQLYLLLGQPDALVNFMAHDNGDVDLIIDEQDRDALYNALAGVND